MVEITFKTLTQEAFKLELQPSDKVSFYFYIIFLVSEKIDEGGLLDR